MTRVVLRTEGEWPEGIDGIDLSGFQRGFDESHRGGSTADFIAAVADFVTLATPVVLIGRHYLQRAASTYAKRRVTVNLSGDDKDVVITLTSETTPEEVASQLSKISSTTEELRIVFVE